MEVVVSNPRMFVGSKIAQAEAQSDWRPYAANPQVAPLPVTPVLDDLVGKLNETLHDIHVVDSRLANVLERAFGPVPERDENCSKESPSPARVDALNGQVAEIRQKVSGLLEKMNRLETLV